MIMYYINKSVDVYLQKYNPIKLKNHQAIFLNKITNMRKYFLFLALIVLAASCKKENEVEEKVAAVPVKDVKIERFDKIFFESGPEELPAIKQKFPYLFPEGNTDKDWLDRMQDPNMKKLYNEVQKKYPSLNELENDFEDLFKHIKFYYPKLKEPQVVTLVSDDIEIKSIYADNLVLIPLSLYLGKDNPLYEGLPKYIVKNFEPNQILPDVVSSFSNGKILPVRDRALISFMIYYGKELYLKDMLLPDMADSVKIGYTEEEIKWCQANEAEMWKYFIEEKLLFDTDAKLGARFIEPAPFSKFYREIDNDTPGRVGQWLGWQIVRSYMENNKDVTLQDLLAKDAKEIFDNSKYKPSK
jgi:gliding motility-associated lipoprotein GldB